VATLQQFDSEQSRANVRIMRAILIAIVPYFLCLCQSASAFQPSVTGDFKAHLLGDYFVIRGPGVRVSANTLHIVRQVRESSFDFVVEDVSSVGLLGTDIFGRRDDGSLFIFHTKTGAMLAVENEEGLKRLMAILPADPLPEFQFSATQRAPTTPSPPQGNGRMQPLAQPTVVILAGAILIIAVIVVVVLWRREPVPRLSHRDRHRP
jgi:hypothetical protein